MSELDLLQKLWNEFRLLASSVDEYCDDMNHGEEVEPLMTAIADHRDMEDLRIALHKAGVDNIPGIV